MPVSLREAIHAGQIYGEGTPFIGFTDERIVELAVKRTLNAIPQSLALLDNNGVPVFQNKFSELKIPSEELPLIIALSNRIIVEAKEMDLQLGDGMEFNIQFPSPIDDRTHSYRISISPFGEDKTMVAIVNDTEIRQELENTAQELQEMQEVGSIATHDLRGPLTAVIGQAQLGLKVNHPESKDKCFDSINKGAKRMNALIQDIVDAFKAGYEISLESMNIIGLLDEIVNEKKAEMENKGIKLQLDIDGNVLTGPFNGDMQKLRIAFEHLITNAIHAMEELNNEEKLLSIRCEAQKDNIDIEIEDTGKGIPLDEHPNIGKFGYTTKRNNPEQKGTGMGVYTAHKIVNKHGGKMSFRSVTQEMADANPSLGSRGTTFKISLPRY